MGGTSRWLRDSTVILALSVAPFALTRTGLAQERPQSDDTPHVETVGSGERRVAPDRASVMLQIETKAPSAAAAASANARAVTAVRDTLQKLGLDSAVTTATYNVGPNYERPGPRGEAPERVGDVAHTILRVQLTRLDQTGRVIDAGLARGATGVQGMIFEASTAEDARRFALADAAGAARKDAEALARALGGSLGALLSVSTAGAYDPRRMNLVSTSTEQVYRGTGITPNEIVVRAAVITRWRFVAGTR